jgi:hypothetical protein
MGLFEKSFLEIAHEEHKEYTRSINQPHDFSLYPFPDGPIVWTYLLAQQF